MASRWLEAYQRHLVKAAEWVDWVDEGEESILESSFLQGAEAGTLAQPGPLRVPETILTERFDYRVDLWRAGCMVSEDAHTSNPQFI